MPTYDVTAPDGRKLRITGDRPPTGDELNEIFAQRPPATEKPPSDRPARGAALGGVLGSLLAAAAQVHPLGRLAAAAGGGLLGAMAGGDDPLSAVSSGVEQGLYEVPGLGLEQLARAGHAGGAAMYRKAFGPVPMKAVKKAPAFMSTGSVSEGEQQILQDAMRRGLVLNNKAAPRLTTERQGLGNRVGQEIQALPDVSPQVVYDGAEARVRDTVGTQLAPGGELAAAQAKLQEFANNPAVSQITSINGQPQREFLRSIPAADLHKLKVQTGRRLKAAVGSPEAVAPGTEGNRALFESAQEQLPITPELSDQYGRTKALETAVKLRRPSNGVQPYMGVSLLSGSPFGGLSASSGSGRLPLKMIQLSDLLKARLPLATPQALRGLMLMGDEGQ